MSDSSKIFKTLDDRFSSAKNFGYQTTVYLTKGEFEDMRYQYAICQMKCNQTVSDLEDEASRFKWLAENHVDDSTRKKRDDILGKMSTMSHEALCAAIDLAMQDSTSMP